MKYCFIVLLSVLSYTLIAQTPYGEVTIVRDKWGIPHIYAQSDAGMSYGLMWAACEDDFNSVQEHLLAAQKKLAQVKGKEGAAMDVVAHILEADRLVKEQYKEGVFSDTYELMLEASLMACNDYAATHPKEVLLKSSFPATKEDLLASHIIGVALTTHFHYNISNLTNDSYELSKVPQSAGSNAFAMNGVKSENGQTYFCMNSHQPLVGPYSWYEAHTVSEESGIDNYGASFPGGTQLFLAANENFAWTHTLNRPDFTDFYKLVMHPKKKRHYKYGEEYLELEDYPLKIKVKVMGFLKMPVKLKFYKSKHGVVLENKHGYYAFRTVANSDILAGEQWYAMNKAKDYTAFKEALAMQHIPSTNIVYADKTGMLYFLSNGKFPVRDENKKWNQILPGDDPSLVWEKGKYYPIEELAKIENPTCGYIFNTNQSPYTSTAKGDHLNSSWYNSSFAYTTTENNRSLRMAQLFEAKEKLSYEDFKALKYDLAYEDTILSAYFPDLNRIFEFDTKEYPQIAPALKRIKQWDKKADYQNTNASIVSVTLHYLTKGMIESGNIVTGKVYDDAFYIDCIEKAQKFLLKHHGSLDVPLEKVQYITVDKKHFYGIDGMPDMIRAMYFNEVKKGKLVASVGDAFINFITWDDYGVQMEACNFIGQSKKSDSPHFDDQVELFQKGQLRKVYFKKNEVIANAKSIYKLNGKLPVFYIMKAK